MENFLAFNGICLFIYIPYLAALTAAEYTTPPSPSVPNPAPPTTPTKGNG